MLHACGFLSICQITALMVLHVPCLQRVLPVTASIDNLPTLAGAMDVLSQVDIPTHKHRDNSTFTATRYSKRQRHSRARRSQDAGNAYAQQPPPRPDFA
jgi:hypothetical protein